MAPLKLPKKKKLICNIKIIPLITRERFQHKCILLETNHLLEGQRGKTTDPWRPDVLIGCTFCEIWENRHKSETWNVGSDSTWFRTEVSSSNLRPISRLRARAEEKECPIIWIGPASTFTTTNLPFRTIAGTTRVTNQKLQSSTLRHLIALTFKNPIHIQGLERRTRMTTDHHRTLRR